jgi:2-keto-3-deoxy-L-rhamnonate aldolase RhmA
VNAGAPNPLHRESLRARPALGGWLQIGHPAPAEIHARAGFDWVCVDLEHGIVDIETMAGIFRAVSGSDCVPVARVPANDPVWIRRALDAGARAVIVPMVNSGDEAERAVRAAKFPPRGERGFGYCRANAHGADFAEFARTANDEIAVVLQIEHIQAVENLEAIVAVADVDALFIGPYDLSGSLGVPGELQHPKVLAALERFRSVCSGRGMAAGLHLVRPTEESVRRSLAKGYRLLALGLDTVFLETAARQALAWARREAPPQRQRAP